MSTAASSLFTLPQAPTSTTSLSQEPVEGNSLDQFMRSLNNWLGSQGQTTFNYGQGLTQAAAGGLNTASQTLAPSNDYWSKLLSGDKATMSAAIAPTASGINSQYDQASRQAGMNLPRGGYASSVQANLPFQKAQQVGNLLETLQPTAATQLAGNAGIQGQLAQILGQLGLGTSAQGSGLLSQTSNNQLTRRGQNVNQDNNGALGQFLSGLAGIPGAAAGSILGGLTSKIGNLGNIFGGSSPVETGM